MGLPGISGGPGSHLVVVLPDLHIPYHDKKVLECVLRAIEYLQPYKTVVLGDWLDCDSFSKHPKKTMRELKAVEYRRDEIDPCNVILDEIQNWCKKLVFIEGNHEFRVERMAAEFGAILGPDIFDLMSPQTLLSAGRTNFEWVPYGECLPRHEITPNLIAVHGWSHSTHAAATHLKQAKTCSIVHGHTHRYGVASSRNALTGEIYRGWSPGCLSKLQPMYRHQSPTNWCNGFSIIYVGQDPRDWSEYHVLIQNGRCILPDGKEILAK